MLLKRVRTTVSTPGEAEEILEQRLKALGMSFNEYVNSLITYDCWAEKSHALTGSLVKDKETEGILWTEIIRDFGKKDKTGGFFDHRIDDIVRSRVSAHDEAGD